MTTYTVMGIISFILKKKKPSQSQKILIVDDSAENRLLLELILKKAGFQTILCDDGAKAVEIVSKKDISLILMDIYMKDMDGIEATKIIKSNNAIKNIPIIAVTAADSPEERTQRIEAGMDDYVAKPVEPINLLKRIARQLKISAQMECVLNGEKILSINSSDPTYKKAIKIFVKSLPDRVNQIKSSFDSNNFDALRRQVHNLKGTGGMAGFDVYTAKAIKIEKLLNSKPIDTEMIKTQIDELIDMSNRTRKTCK